MNIFGSLLYKVKKEAVSHINKNKYIKKYKPGFVNNYFHKIYDNFEKFLLTIMFVTVLILVILNKYYNFNNYFDEYILSNNFKIDEYAERVYKIILSIQVTIVSIIIPITIALVSIFVQARGFSYSNPRIRIYLHESNSLNLVISSFTLLILVSVYLLFLKPFDVLYLQPTYLNQIQFFLSWFFGGWLIFNILATWYFIQTSILFINPKQQKNIIYNHLTRAAFKQSLIKAIAPNYIFSQSKSGGMPENIYGCEIIYSDIILKESDESVEVKLKEVKILNDIYFFPLRMALMMWAIRSLFVKHRKIYLPIMIRRYFKDRVFICKRIGGRKFNPVEIFLIKLSFSFCDEEK